MRILINDVKHYFSDTGIDADAEDDDEDREDHETHVDQEVALSSISSRLSCEPFALSNYRYARLFHC